jgi:hypothetical protein
VIRRYDQDDEHEAPHRSHRAPGEPSGRDQLARFHGDRHPDHGHLRLCPAGALSSYVLICSIPSANSASTQAVSSMARTRRPSGGSTKKIRVRYQPQDRESLLRGGGREALQRRGMTRYVVVALN